MPIQPVCRPVPLPNPPPPRLSLREILFLAVCATWVLVVVLTDRAAPLTPPVVPYAIAASR
ncbi:hypothetical protein [Methylobacterium trifolii]|uniref:Uncharacterized protein n=1 Tax=Methylobacterium trifolii TaxID=1003092 RepID=A0ABQ4U1W7_9HYPH|nr:hypothetical protein [Methylobacterium trifolii]GJE60963.1 hypothetical protein MPOCJGCO_3082 [Methylobacterium trifolii]